jgi:Uma2 family endonuclease
MTPTTTPPPQKVRPVFPDSDGRPMADNTLQYEWISTIKWNLEHLFAGEPEVFVAGDNLIYPVGDDATIRAAPDVYVAFGRPKGYRGSYKVWEEDGVFPQVIFEVWSPGNEWKDMEEKRQFYEKYGALEYYVIYPQFPAHAEGWWRESGALVRTKETNGFVSPRLGVRFHFLRGEVTLYGPNGEPFRNPAQIAAERDRERQRAEQEKQRADEETRQKEAERQRAQQEKQRAEKLAAKLRELGVDPDAV